MKNRNRTMKLVAAVASLTLVVAACGSDSDDSADNDAAVATVAPAADDTTTETTTDTTDATTDDVTGTTEAMTDESMDDGDMDGAMLEPSGPLCSAVPTDGEGSFEGMADDPAGTAASNNPALSTLVSAVEAAGLVDTLNSDGPFTIFAPANPAFDAIDPATLDAVLADQELLTSILTLHVIAGEELSSEELAEMGSATTVNGEDITFEVQDDGTLMVNGQATVGCADVPTANATVHVIDAVLMPAS